ncbi:MAG TPA: DUF533 domain-containing protein [Alphaproteobacteria bacterium]|nr:DUF533 domain-containing protein [Alphaproteobacteria bacterium]
MSLQNVLGAMMGTGMGGRSMRGPGFGSMGIGIPGMGGMGGLGPLAAGMALGGLGGGMGGMSRRVGGSPLGGGLGLAALGALAFKAYRDYQASQPQQAPQAPQQAPMPRGQSAGGGSSLGDRLGGMIGQRLETGHAPEEVIEDKKALLLIRAMIAAAAADGAIDAQERQHMLDQLQQAGASRDDVALLEREIAHPVALDILLREVDTPEEAEMFYLTSSLAMGEQSGAERSYLQYLSSRLSLDPDRVAELDRLANAQAGGPRP